MTVQSKSPGRLTRAELLSGVSDALSASLRRKRGLRLGLEAELIPVLADSGARLPLDSADPDRADIRSLMTAVSGERRWKLEDVAGVPRVRIPDVGVLTLEPGGQLEIASQPFSSVDRLVSAVNGVLATLLARAEEQGIRLIARGMDPMNDVDQVPFVVDTPRYRKQKTHYDSLGPWGARMMVLSAAIHVNVDLGGRAVRRWWVANRMAPLLTALFANAPRTLDDGTKVRSWRAEQWRRLDPTRTGIFGDEVDPAGEYLGFALNARDFLATEDGTGARPFRASWDAGADAEAWRGHLSTLFPEVRPRGYLELRSMDALRPAWYAVPLVLVAGLLYDPTALGEAQRTLPAVETDILVRSGRKGLGDPEIQGHAATLFDLALEGAGRLGAAAVGPDAMESALEFRDRFVDKGKDPGTEPDGLNLFDR